MPDLRPGNRGIGVSVAVEHSQVKRGFALREVIRPLNVRDADAGSLTTLQPGSILSSCRIRRTPANCGEEAYLMEFLFSGRRYACPLYLFQPRTRVLEVVRVEEVAVRETVAV